MSKINKVEPRINYHLFFVARDRNGKRLPMQIERFDSNDSDEAYNFLGYLTSKHPEREYFLMAK